VTWARARCITAEGEQCHWRAKSFRRSSSSVVSQMVVAFSPFWRLPSRGMFGIRVISSHKAQVA